MSQRCQVTSQLPNNSILNDPNGYEEVCSAGADSYILKDDGSQLPYEDRGNATQHYEEEWRRLFKDPDFVSYIKRQGIEGRLRNCRFRSICWRIFLECLGDDPSEWKNETIKAREKYNNLKEKYLMNPRIDEVFSDLTLNNPLSQEETSPWNRYFQDSELKITIRQDVIRTFPEIEFFHLQKIRDMMVTILFCFAREFPNMSYKQGMHEILAPIIFILHSDHQAFLHALEIELIDLFADTDSDLVKFLLDPEFIEHDSFFMFSQVMEVIEPWYIVRDIYPVKANAMSVRLFARPQDLNPTNVIVFKLTRIHDQLLKKYDCQLYLHLEKLEIAPQIYGIRWLRLLFGREFPLQDLLMIWDVIFADSMTFDLVDYIFVSMLIFIRDILIIGDYATCLTCLMKYPVVADVQYIIDVALHLKDPNNHSKPCGYSSQMLHHKPTVGGRVDIHRAPVRADSVENLREQNKLGQKGNKVMTGFSTLTKKMTPRPKTLALSQEALQSEKHVTNASSEPATFGSRSPSPTLTAYIIEHSATSNKHATELKSLQNKSEDKMEGDSSKKLNRRDSWSFKRSRDLKSKEPVQESSRLQGELHDLQAMCAYCSSKMTIHIDRLQDSVLKQNVENEDEMLIALAGLKQVRDILKGTLKFSQNILDGDDIVISDNHYEDGTNQQEPLIGIESN